MTSARNDVRRELEVRLFAWIARFLRIHLKDVSLDTRINHDLGVDGLDGVEMIREFGEEFSVDVSNFPYDKYFGPEAGPNPFWPILAIVNLMRNKHPTGLEPLYVRDLFEMANSNEKGPGSELPL